MKTLIHPIALLAFAALSLSTAAAESPEAAPAKTGPAPAAAAAPATSAPAAPSVASSAADSTAPRTPLKALESRLDAALKEASPETHAVPDLYVAARARLGEAKALWKESPKSPEAGAAFEACSLLTEAAVSQIRAQALQLERASLQEERTRVLGELALVHDEINKIERSHSSSLKADLEEQRRKAAQAREEAEKKFSELNSALIQVSRDARGTIISMSDILFDVGKATLTTDLKTSLAKIAGILTIYKDANVLVEGHTDNVGGEEYNQKLSEKRAQNVMDFLINPGGIAAERLSAVGHGFNKPIADNATKEGRQKNRRVDLVIMDKKSP